MKFKPMQSVLGIKLWGAISGKFSFLIGYEVSVGYKASYKDREYLGPQSSQYIGTFTSFKEAEDACKTKRRELRKN